MTKSKTNTNHRRNAMIAVILACLMMMSMGSISAFAMGESKSDPWPYDTRGLETYTEDNGTSKTVYTFDYLNKTVYIDSSSTMARTFQVEPLYDDGNDIVHFQLLNGQNFYVKYLSHNLY